jgi:hypothetical protein
MLILIAGLVAAVALILLPRFLGRRQERMLGQYAVLEKRFGLTRRVSQSRWGKGIGERFSLHGESRGYPLSLYSHFVQRGKLRPEWTSLVFEALFTEDLEFCIEFEGTDRVARFDAFEGLGFSWQVDGIRFSASEDLGRVCSDASVAHRFKYLSQQTSCGAIRLSKGFLEYREVGQMEEEAQRLRFQEAILLLASLCDALSLYMSDRRVLVAQ